MNSQPLTSAARLTILGLVGTAIGIWIQAVSGVPDYPSRFPPGPIILIVFAAAIVVGARWWWPPLLGALLSGLIIVGAFVRPGTGQRLSDPSAVAAFTGTLIQVVALGVGLIAGVAATVQGFVRRGSRVAPR